MTPVQLDPAPLVSVRRVSFMVYDFDGVMTDNRVLVFEDGREAVFANRGDGLAIARLRKLGVHQIIISTEENPVVSIRAAKLRIPVIQGVGDKAAVLMAYAAEHGYDLANAIYVGNDANDLAAMHLVGYPVVPADAHSCVKSGAVRIVHARGGEGVIRELFDLLSDTGGIV